ncbi:hypothetical protein [Actinocorallia aurantiaca]|uniref:Guanylate cyclase domain-containing protein n=1 Tax=Actinocorallia aurantiaca TaxID=46204 RepID=A0ABN3UFB4_9ACTN
MEDFHALLVVDVERFSSHRDSDLPDLHLEIRAAVASAFEASGLGEVWKAVRFLESTGDGLLAALPHRTLPALIDPFPLWLQEALAQAAPRLRARGMRLRLRAALHVGLLDEERLDTPGISTAVIDVNRLLDADPLRDALKNSDPDSTFTAFLLSEEVFTTYVRGGRTELRASRFTEVRVKVKQFDRPAHLYVPVPSRIETPAEAAPAASPPVRRPGGTPAGGVTINGDRNQNVFGNEIGGDFRMGRP